MEKEKKTERVSDEILSQMDRDSLDRYQIQKIYTEPREHRVCRSMGAMDFSADEFLYRPSELGETLVRPERIPADSVSGLEIEYCCGEKTLERGSYVRFEVHGQQPLGRVNFQAADPEADGYVWISTPEGVEAQLYYLGFRITRGTLRQGQKVILRIEKPFCWTPIADRYEMKTVIGFSCEECERRLCAPNILQVDPLPVSVLEAVLPVTSRGEDVVRVHVTARDRLDNPVKINAWVRINGQEAFMVSGRCDSEVPVPSGSTSFCAEVILPAYGLKCESNPCVIAAKEDYQFYTGDLHVHDFLSEAHQYTDRVYDWARNERNFDFVSVSEQTHGWIDNEKWTIVKYMNERYLEEGRFVTLLANEWQHTMYGDKIIHHLGGTQPYFTAHDGETSTAKALYEKCRQGETVVISHHTAYTAGSWRNSTDFDRVETDVERLCELWSMHGSSEGFDENDRPLNHWDWERTVYSALRRGIRLGFVAGSDTHSGRAGGSAKEPGNYWGGCCGVLAKSLTRKGIFEALRARRTVALTGERIYLCMKVNGAYMGSEIPESETARLAVDVIAPAKIAEIMIMKNAEPDKRITGMEKEAHLELTESCRKGDFFHVRVRLENGSLAVCSPVWVG